MRRRCRRVLGERAALCEYLEFVKDHNSPHGRCNVPPKKKGRHIPSRIPGRPAISGDLNEAAKASGWTIVCDARVCEPPQPSTLKDETAIPVGIRALDQWVCWKLLPRGGKPRKVPYMPCGMEASSTDPATWTSLDKVLAAYRLGGFSGIGFVFSSTDPFIGVDFDHVRVVESEKWEPGALEEIQSLGSYAELSPSGTGAHVIVKGEIPGHRRRRGDREVYDRARFFTVTGAHMGGTPEDINDPGAVLFRWYRWRIEPPSEIRHPAPPCPSAPPAVNIEDQEIIDLCNRAANSARFNALWQGDTGGYVSASEADLALIGILKFYTQDMGQLDRLYRMSALYRPKWDEKRGAMTYGQRTITEALRCTGETYSAPLRPKIAKVEYGN
jgi:putative DNA primase/helicase